MSYITVHIVKRNHPKTDAFMLQNFLDEGTDPWGVKVERTEM